MGGVYLYDDYYFLHRDKVDEVKFVRFIPCRLNRQKAYLGLSMMLLRSRHTLSLVWCFCDIGNSYIKLMVQYYHMLQFYQKRTLRAWLHSPLALGILAIIILFMMSVVYQRYSIEQDMVARRMEAAVQLQQLEDRRAELEKKVEYLSNERGIEAEMRRNFDVARPGEQVVIILDEEKKPDIEPLTPTVDDKPWYKFW